MANHEKILKTINYSDMVEVFKTNVQSIQQSSMLLSRIRQSSPELLVNFDLEDCDKILRVEGKRVPFNKIIKIVVSEGYFCEVLL
jgi:hypothetical protein